MNKFLSILKALGAMLILLISQVIFGIMGTIVYTFYYLISNNITDPNIDMATLETEILNGVMQNMTLILLVSSVFVIFVLWLVYVIGKKDFKKEIKLIKTKKSNIIRGIIIGLCMWMINTVFIGLLRVSGLFESSFQTFEDLTSTIVQGNLIITIIAAGIIGPIEEEILCRGVIFNVLKKNFSAFWAILIQAVLFGALHGNLIQFLYATFIGLVLGYITYKTKSIYPAIAVHISNNIIACISEYIIPSEIGTAGTIVFICLVILSFVSLVVCLRRISKENSNNELEVS